MFSEMLPLASGLRQKVSFFPYRLSGSGLEQMGCKGGSKLRPGLPLDCRSRAGAAGFGQVRVCPGESGPCCRARVFAQRGWWPGGKEAEDFVCPVVFGVADGHGRTNLALLRVRVNNLVTNPHRIGFQ